MWAMARGNLTQRGPGRWQIQISNGFDPITGKRRKIIRTINARTKRDAEQALTRLLAEVDLGRHIGADLTVAQLMDAWLAARSPHWSPSTAKDTPKLIAHWITPRIGTVPIYKLNPGSIATFYRACTVDGCSVARLRKVHANLSAAMSWAVRCELLATNPARHVAPPVPPKAQTRATPPDVACELTAAATGRLRLAIVLDSQLGARRGELCGLQWRDIDLEAGIITIARAVVHGAAGLVVKGTKTDRVRRLAIPPALANVLRSERRTQQEACLAVGEPWDDERHVLTNELDGAPPRPDWLTLAYARLRAKVPSAAGYRLHDIRHMVATELLAAGYDVKTVQTRLGHSSATVTLDTYAHAIPATDRAAADTMGRLLSGA